MVRRLGSAVRCSSAGVCLWVPLAPSQCSAHAPTRRGLGEAEGRRGGGACALQCVPQCLAPSRAERVQRRGGRTQGRCLQHPAAAASQQQPCPLPGTRGACVWHWYYAKSSLSSTQPSLHPPQPPQDSLPHPHISLLPSLLGMLWRSARRELSPERARHAHGAQRERARAVGEAGSEGRGGRGGRRSAGGADSHKVAPHRCTAHLKRMPPARLHCSLHPQRASGPLTPRSHLLLLLLPPPPHPTTVSVRRERERVDHES
eukprot:3683695-Rhodomonas_salina.2